MKSDNLYTIDWEAGETTERIQATLDFLNKGCTCKTGCKTKRCRCRKQGRECGAGCECKGCTNITLSHPSTHMDEDDHEIDEFESDDSELEIEDSDEELETEVVTDTLCYDADQMAI